MRKAQVYYQNYLAGIIKENESGYSFRYDIDYLASDYKIAVSKTLPLMAEEYFSSILFPFFDGLIPEGWVLEIVEENWKLNPRDRFGILLKSCKDCIGAVSIIELIE